MNKKTKVISVYIHKGGVGKSTTTINLAQILGEEFGKKVLVIDHDAQNSLSFLANVDINQLGRAESQDGVKGMNTIGYLEQLFQYFGHNHPMSLTPDDIFDTIITPQYIESVNEKGVFGKVEKINKFAFDLIPGVGEDLSLSELVYLVADTPEQLVFINQPKYRELAKFVMRYIIEMIIQEMDYDYILIDCPPSLGILSINALNASNSVIIPVNMDTLATIGIPRVVSTLESLELMLPDFKIRGILFNEYKNNKENNQLVSDVEGYAYSKDITVFKTKIPQITEIKNKSKEERLAVQTVPKYKESIMKLAKEIIEQDEGDVL